MIETDLKIGEEVVIMKVIDLIINFQNLIVFEKNNHIVRTRYS